MAQQSRLPSFLAELKRRRVFRVAAVYGGVAFVLFQIIDSIFQPLHIPEWIGSLIIILLLVGFPLAVGLAWVFDITPEGIVRTQGTTSAKQTKPLTGNRALIVIAVLAIAFGIWGRWGGPLVKMARLLSLSCPLRIIWMMLPRATWCGGSRRLSYQNCRELMPSRSFQEIRPLFTRQGCYPPRP